MNSLAQSSATIISMVISIRQATIQDVALLQKLNQEVFVEDFQYDTDLDMDWAMGEPGKNYFTKAVSDANSVCFIAKIDNKAAGYIAVGYKRTPFRKSRYLEVENIGVSPEFRSKGVGAMLVKKAKNWGKEHGFSRLFVNSYFHNHRAVEFYMRNGFAEVDLGLEMKI